MAGQDTARPGTMAGCKHIKKLTAAIAATVNSNSSPVPADCNLREPEESNELWKRTVKPCRQVRVETLLDVLCKDMPHIR